MPELSIIVPVYKVEKLLPKCIDSILAQTFTDFELILIDDGSPDNCGAICDEYAKKDSRIIVIHQENRGVSAARNAGLDIATGTYLGFVDSDDTVGPDMYEILIGISKKESADVVACGFISDISSNAQEDKQHLNERKYSKEDLLFDLFGKPSKTGGSSCNKVFLRDKIKDVRFDESITIAEDKMYLLDCYRLIDSGYRSDEKFYRVGSREDSAVRASYTNALRGCMNTSLIMTDKASEYSNELCAAALDKYLDDCLIYIKQLRLQNSKTNEKNSKEILRTKKSMIKAIYKAIRMPEFSRSKIHGYIYEMVRL